MVAGNVGRRSERRRWWPMAAEPGVRPRRGLASDRGGLASGRGRTGSRSWRGGQSVVAGPIAASR